MSFADQIKCYSKEELKLGYGLFFSRVIKLDFKVKNFNWDFLINEDTDL